MKKIEKPEEVVFSPDWFMNIVALTGIDGDSKVLQINYSIDDDGSRVATLKDIQSQFLNRLIVILIETPTSGSVYRYNNYNDGLWYLVGSLDGFA